MIPFVLRLDPHFKEKRQYPYPITRGLLNNRFRQCGERSLSNFATTRGDDAVTLCIKALFLTEEKYDVYWSQYQIEKGNGRSRFHLPCADLICEIEILGGTYARIEDYDMIWNSEKQAWCFPELTVNNPFFTVAMIHILRLETDGKGLRCLVGILASKTRKDYQQAWLDGDKA